jgi:hypothetical protein
MNHGAAHGPRQTTYLCAAVLAAMSWLGTSCLKLNADYPEADGGMGGALVEPARPAGTGGAQGSGTGGSASSADSGEAGSRISDGGATDRASAATDRDQAAEATGDVSPPTSVDSGCMAPQCTPTCESGRHRCGANCVADDDVNACGPSCMQCGTATDQHATCSSATCGTECNVVCSEGTSTCPRSSWDFESGTNDGLQFEEGGVTDARAHAGRYSVASRKWVKSPAIQGGTSSMQIGVCTGTTNLLGETLTAWVYVEGSEFVSGKDTVCQFGFDVEGGFNSSASTMVPSRDRWFRISAKPFLPTKTSYLSVICWIKPAVGESWQGTVYFDDVTIE